MTVACGLYSCFLPRSFHPTLYPIFSLGLVHSCILLVGRSLSPLPLCLSMSLPLPAPDPPSFHKGSLPSPGIHPSPVRSPPRIRQNGDTNRGNPLKIPQRGTSTGTSNNTTGSNRANSPSGFPFDWKATRSAVPVNFRSFEDDTWYTPGGWDAFRGRS